MLDYRTHTFLEVCRCGSFTRAAEALRITQPAVSQHIRHLERHYRTELFSHRGRGLALTPTGERLYTALLTLANDERKLESELAGAEDAESALSFGVTLTVSDFVMPTCLAAHRAAHPRERLSMAVGNTRDLLARIDAGSIECALVEGYFDARRYDALTFSTEPYVAVCAGDASPHPSKLPKRIETVGELLGETLLVRERGSGTREILEKHLAARNLSTSSFRDALELGGIAPIKALAAAGAGVAFLYRIAVERELATGTLRDVTPADFRIEHDLALVWQRGSMYGDRYRALFSEWQRAYAAARAEGAAP